MYYSFFCFSFISCHSAQFSLEDHQHIEEIPVSGRYFWIFCLTGDVPCHRLFFLCPVVLGSTRVVKLFSSSCSVVRSPYFLLLSCLCLFTSHTWYKRYCNWKPHTSRKCEWVSMFLFCCPTSLWCTVSCSCSYWCLLFFVFSLTEKVQFKPCIINIQNSSLTNCIIGNNNRQCITCDQLSLLAQNDAINGKSSTAGNIGQVLLAL